MLEMTEANNSNGNKNTYKPIFDKAKEQLVSLEKTKKQTILDTAKRLEESNMPKEMISSEMARQLDGYGVSKQYIRKCLEPEQKQESKIRNDNNIAKQVAQAEKQLIEVTTSGQQEPSTPTQPERPNIAKALAPVREATTQDIVEVWLDLSDIVLWRKLFNIKNVGSPKVYFKCTDSQVTEIIGPNEKRKK
jgi:hypothetical protein